MNGKYMKRLKNISCEGNANGHYNKVSPYTYQNDRKEN